MRFAFDSLPRLPHIGSHPVSRRKKVSNVMSREPVLVPRKPGVFALVNKKRRLGYVAYTNDLQKRSHSLAHMLQNPKTHWSINALPKHPANEFTFVVLNEGILPAAANKLIKAAEADLKSKNYRLVDGSRSAVPMVTLNGEEMALTDAITKAGSKAKYITVWRRLARGWSVDQALDLVDPPVRWDPEQVAARRKRAEKRAAA